MLTRPDHDQDKVTGIGFYTIPEAARLLKMPPRNINRWIGGYSFQSKSRDMKHMPPLWAPQWKRDEGGLALGFRDLIELKFVRDFLEAGITLPVIRACMALAANLADDPHPFSTRRFKTDGKTIFAEALNGQAEASLLDLRQRQYVIAKAVEQSFKDLDIAGDVVAQWRPFDGRSSIVVDPQRAFGKPILSSHRIPTAIIAEAAKREKNLAAVADLYEIPEKLVRDAVEFERQLAS